MKLKYLSLIAALPLLAMASGAQAQRAGDKIAGSYICVFKANAVSRGNVEAEAHRAAQAAGGEVTHVYEYALHGFAAHMSPQGLENARRANQNIAYCEQDQVMSIPPVQATGQPSGGFTAQAQETPWGIARVGGGVAGATGTAWIIDTGIDPTHPELNVDQTRSRSFLGKGSAPWDQNGHGTHVSGTIAARDDGNGVIGVAPNAKVVAVRVLDRRGSGTNSGVIDGVNYVAQYGQVGDVANMSLGGGVSQALDDAVVAASSKVRFALAAGNDGGDANLHSPARANGPNVYTVSAIDSTDTLASFSNYGNPPVDYAEPGVGIKSTWLNGGYNTISGTSMATPHLAGLLLIGAIRSGGTIKGDKDNTPDTIGIH